MRYAVLRWENNERSGRLLKLIGVMTDDIFYQKKITRSANGVLTVKARYSRIDLYKDLGAEKFE